MIPMMGMYSLTKKSPPSKLPPSPPAVPKLPKSDLGRNNQNYAKKAKRAKKAKKIEKRQNTKEGFKQKTKFSQEKIPGFSVHSFRSGQYM